MAKKKAPDDMNRRGFLKLTGIGAGGFILASSNSPPLLNTALAKDFKNKADFHSSWTHQKRWRSRQSRD